MSGAGAEKYQKTVSKKKIPNKPVTNSEKGVKDKGKGKKREVEAEDLGLQKEERNGEDACRQIENSGGGSSSAATPKRKSDGRGGGSLGGNKQPEHKKQKRAKQSQERKDLELKVKTKLKREGEDAGGREVVKKKVGETKKKKEKKKEEEDEGGAGCRFPMSRIDRIIRSEASDYRITQEAVFLINKATEKFLEVFSEDSYKRAAQDCKSYVSYKNLSSVVSKDKSLYFLSDYIPEKVKAEDALAERKLAEK